MLLEVWEQTNPMSEVEDNIKKVIESLDKICPACLAATSQETFELLHQGKDCKLDPREAHYADPRRRCATCGSAELQGEGMGCEIWRYRCLTCGADPA